ncbi:hypothetical protein CK203_111002 [Vitis vinifera]|uniref:Uncharacterized protein n=1 Tax=Vitis vinifera TaxID=29760 RepID=A0A438FDQ6_VITVI|nr:hypothetical protein CK203_111002 [Vitis vinifera]
MGTVEIEAPIIKTRTDEDVKEDELSPIEEVRLTVPTTMTHLYLYGHFECGSWDSSPVPSSHSSTSSSPTEKNPW